MIVPQVGIDQIRSARLRMREMYLPVSFGEFGERKRCPVRVGRAYELRPPMEWHIWRSEAASQSSRAYAVIWLIDRCLRPVRTVVITVTSVEECVIEDQRLWLIKFTKGDQTTRQDKPRFMAAKPGAPHGDYVGNAALALKGEMEALPANILEQYAKDAEGNQSRAAWEPVHGPAARIAHELPGMRKEITAIRNRLERSGLADRSLEMEIERLEKGAKLMEGALDRMRDRLVEAM